MTATIPEWLDWLAEQVGTRKWVVAGRLTDRLRRKGYEVAIHPKRYSALALQFGAAITAGAA